VETHNVETSAAVERESTTHTASATHSNAVTTTHAASATHGKAVTTTHSAVSTAAVSTAAVSTATAAGGCNSWGKSDRCTDCGGGGNRDERFSKHGSISSLDHGDPSAGS
jgi:hypothetical protein